MPNICSVPKCKGNYRNGPKVTVFKFPLHNRKLTEKWVRAIKRDFHPTPHSKVCELHFCPEDIIQEASFFDEKSGKNVTVPLERKALRKDAVPSRMPNCPTYMSREVVLRETSESRKTRKQNEQLQKAIEASRLSKEQYDAEHCFETFEGLKSKLHLLTVPEDWCIIAKPTGIMLCKIDMDPNPFIRLSVVVNCDLQMNVFYQNTVLKNWGNNRFPVNVNNVNTISDILSELMKHEENGPEDKVSASLEIVKNILCNILSDAEEDNASVISFIMQQIDLLQMKMPSYRSEFLVFAALFKSISPHAYRFVRSSGNMKLPHPTTLDRMCATSLLNPIQEQGDTFLQYIKFKFSSLKEEDKRVILLVDEIHIKPFIDYKGGNIVGSAYNSTKMASTAHVFMISGVTSTYKDVAHILPVQTLSHFELHTFFKKIIIELEAIGFSVIGVITDNNAINRSAMADFVTPPTNEFVYPHPVDKSRPLFHLFDSVHLLKSIRNNWLNQRNPKKCIYFPDFEGFTEKGNEKFHSASFHTLKELHRHEENSLAKFGFNLTLKALAPSNFERQNVNLALKVFNNFVAEALCQLGVSGNLLHSDGTAAFIKIISSWWSIMNVKSAYKGARLNDMKKYPLTDSEDDERMLFLSTFIDWLDKWKDMKCDTGMLTKETHMALRQTTYAITEIASYCSKELGLKYILPGKFQTDNLESRFSLYRQLSGGQYLVSLRQIFESEKKLRMQSSLELVIRTKSQGHVAISVLEETNFENIGDSENKPLGIMLMSEDFSYVGEKLPVLVYIAGYTSYSVNKKLKCAPCKAILTMEKHLDLGLAYKYTQKLDRGQLLFPASSVVNTVMYIFVIVCKLCFDHEEKFLKATNQRAVAAATCKAIIGNEGVFPDFDCANGHNSEYISNMIVWSSVNIFLNNYCKEKNNLRNVSQAGRRLQVFKT